MHAVIADVAEELAQLGHTPGFGHPGGGARGLHDRSDVGRDLPSLHGVLERLVERAVHVKDRGRREGTHSRPAPLFEQVVEAVEVVGGEPLELDVANVRDDVRFEVLPVPSPGSETHLASVPACHTVRVGLP
jgi:hypothetical protein